MSRLKGPEFPSMTHPPQGGASRRYCYPPNHTSMRQAKRNLRNKARHLIDSNDPIVISVGDRVIRAVCEEPDPEYSALHLFCAAIDASNDTGEPWTVCMNYFMDKFEAREKAIDDVIHNQESRKEEPSGHSYLRRLLRSLVPRPLRKGDEKDPKGDIDQSARASDAQSS